MIKYIVPIFILSVLIVGLLKSVPMYDSFVDGVKQAIKLSFNMLPYIATIFIGMELMRISGLTQLLSAWLAPVFKFFGIPVELSELIILRPLSGSGCMAVLDEIYLMYGVDSYIARCGSVIIGCSETIFYITAVYFSTTKIKKLRYAIPVSIISMLIGAIVSCAICKFL